MGKKKLSKAEKKAKKAQDATDALAIVLDRAQLAVNAAGPGDDVSVLKAVIERKKAAFAKLGQRPSEEAMARVCPTCKAAQPRHVRRDAAARVSRAPARNAQLSYGLPYTSYRGFACPEG